MSASMLCKTQTGNRNALWAGEEICDRDFSAIRRRAMLRGCKWDSQVGDVTALARFPLVIGAREWEKISAWAESLASEADTAAGEILARPELIARLGLPGALCRVLAGNESPTPSAGHVMRFDFHFTTEGWRISEANSDVPGGFSEASHFTAMMAEHFPALRMAGNPAEDWANTLACAAGENGAVALLCAPGYMEDHQVIAFLAERLRERGCRAFPAKPAQIEWRDRTAWLDTAWHSGSLDAIVRFYQAEWLAWLPHTAAWAHFFRGGSTPVANPGHAVISESKRFPLVWDRLRTAMETWHALLPETRDPRDVKWDEGWLLKTAMCNTGDHVHHREWMSARDWTKTRLAASLFPGKWVAQRRFESVPVATPDGPRHACVGVYTVNGKVAGAYARLSETPVVNFAATDVALLVDDNE